MDRTVSLRHLRCFVAVAQAGSFTVASSRLFLTQSSLTATIQQFEAAQTWFHYIFDPTSTVRRRLLGESQLHELAPRIAEWHSGKVLETYL